MGAREGRGSSDAPSPGWARGGAVRIPGRWPEFPSTQCAQTRIECEVQKQKRTILRHKQVQNCKHTHTHKRAHTLTPRRPTTARTHTRARALMQPQAQTSPEKSNTQKCPLPHCPLLPPSSVLFSKTKNKNLATTQQRTVRTFE